MHKIRYTCNLLCWNSRWPWENNFWFLKELQRDILKDEYVFEIEGCETTESSIYDLTKVSRNQEYKIDTEQFRIIIPSESIYNDYIPQYEKSSTIENGNYSVIHTIEPYYAGVDKPCNISIKIDCDTVEDKTKYYIASLNSAGVYSISQCIIQQ